mmetsp:Transcript_20884/g.72015  ORF Transcript_20884/g.72015 Transcript_20884/m.72015 type:complete len:200 (-) Transcript_20884:1153-1752(-)
MDGGWRQPCVGDAEALSVLTREREQAPQLVCCQPVRHGAARAGNGVRGGGVVADGATNLPLGSHLAPIDARVVCTKVACRSTCTLHERPRAGRQHLGRIGWREGCEHDRFCSINAHDLVIGKITEDAHAAAGACHIGLSRPMVLQHTCGHKQVVRSTPMLQVGVHGQRRHVLQAEHWRHDAPGERDKRGGNADDSRPSC